MTSKAQYEAQRLYLLGLISELPPEQQERVTETVKVLREVASKDEFGMLAFALVTCEVARDAEKA